MTANKKTMTQRLGVVALSAALITGLFTLSAGAASAAQVTAQLSPQLTIVVDGVNRDFYTVTGVEAHPITYNRTTYLPVRAIGELMGKNVNWDQSTYTVTIGGTRTTAATTGTPDTSAVTQNIAAELRSDFTIVVDGVTRTFRDVNGNVVYPLLYRGSTYLPIRAIGELMGKTVGWNGATNTVTLSSDSLVTDADSFNPGQTTNPGTSTGISVTAEQAKAKALAHAGLTSGQVTFIQCKLDWDDGRQVYDVEFYTADYKEYDYEIDAATGAVVSFDYDADHYTPPQTSTGTSITAEQAKAKALAHAGLTSSQVTFIQCKLDRDDGRQVYDVEFYTADYKEYDYEIDAATGAVVSFDYDADHYTPPQTSNGTLIGVEKAKSIALAKVPGATAANIRKANLDYDDGRAEYEVEIVYNAMEYDFEIDGYTGAIRSWDSESIYD